MHPVHHTSASAPNISMLEKAENKNRWRAFAASNRAESTIALSGHSSRSVCRLFSNAARHYPCTNVHSDDGGKIDTLLVAVGRVYSLFRLFFKTLASVHMGTA